MKKIFKKLINKAYSISKIVEQHPFRLINSGPWPFSVVLLLFLINFGTSFWLFSGDYYLIEILLILLPFFGFTGIAAFIIYSTIKVNSKARVKPLFNFYIEQSLIVFLLVFLMDIFQQIIAKGLFPVNSFVYIIQYCVIFYLLLISIFLFGCIVVFAALAMNSSQDPNEVNFTILFYFCLKYCCIVVILFCLKIYLLGA